MPSFSAISLLSAIVPAVIASPYGGPCCNQPWVSNAKDLAGSRDNHIVEELCSAFLGKFVYETITVTRGCPTLVTVSDVSTDPAVFTTEVVITSTITAVDTIISGTTTTFADVTTTTTTLIDIIPIPAPTAPPAAPAVKAPAPMSKGKRDCCNVCHDIATRVRIDDCRVSAFCLCVATGPTQTVFRTTTIPASTETATVIVSTASPNAITEFTTTTSTDCNAITTTEETTSTETTFIATVTETRLIGPI